MKILLSATTILAVALSAAAPSRAENGRNALAIAGGVAAGAILGSTLARPSAPPSAAYEEEVEYAAPPPRCRLREEPLFDRFGNVVETRMVRKCR